ncbi:WhiB family transcriptional regulator [Streptomyces sp. NPDC059786]|uniref:WhiB family transcriptional regulator n=1 Tax=Streptomyces sp. NPDC059786 TaxID=3346946 RepID=UPI0036665522
MSSALCAQTDPDAWTEEIRGGAGRQPKRICGRCPVRAECRAHAAVLEADKTRDLTGIWGGVGQHQRRVTRRHNEAREAA